MAQVGDTISYRIVTRERGATPDERIEGEIVGTGQVIEIEPNGTLHLVEEDGALRAVRPHEVT